ncbi:MAG: hypothetical protein AAF438_07100 [Pseudomonadota bacterium]
MKPLLRDALLELGGESIVAKGMSYFEDHDLLYQAIEKTGTGLVKMGESPSPDEGALAFEVLFHLLTQNNFLANIDWASDIEEIIDDFDALFTAKRFEPFSSEEKGELRETTENCGRGESFMAVFDLLNNAAKARGMTVTYFDMGWDAHLPIVLSPDTYKKWSRAKFGRKIPVIP